MDVSYCIIVVAALVTIFSALLKVRKWFNSRIMSDSGVEKEIAKICRKEKQYKFNDADVGVIASDLLKIKHAHRLPKELRKEYHDDRKFNLCQFLRCRGWGAGAEEGIIGRSTFKVPDRLRRP